MADFEHEYSDFPNSLIKLHKFKNVDDSVASVFNEINALRAQGYYKQAQKVIEQNNLGQYCPDAVTINTLIEEIFNGQLKTKKLGSRFQVIHFAPSEPDMDEIDLEDVWIGGE